jgi:hypothetical protein
VYLSVELARKASELAERKIGPGTTARSAADKEPQDVGKDVSCLRLQFFRARAGEWVQDEGEGIARGPMRFCDGSAIRDESISADRGNRDATSLQEDSVQHTAG